MNRSNRGSDEQRGVANVFWFGLMFMVLAGCSNHAGHEVFASSQADNPLQIVDGDILECTPGCELQRSFDNQIDMPEWCLEREEVPGSERVLCTKVDLSKISTGVGDYAPELVFGDIEVGNALWRVRCSPGCQLPVEQFGCDKPAGVAPHLPWCALVDNKCNSGQRQLHVASPVPLPEGADPTPHCVALTARNPCIIEEP